MDLGLKDRRALVAAASRGLGRACAEALIAEGARTYIASRDPSAIEATGLAIHAAGWSATDVSKAGQPEALVESAIGRLGGLDVLVVNAGGPPPGTFEKLTTQSWEAAFELTLMSAVRLVHAALPHLQKSDQGRVVFITSITVRQPSPTLVLSNSLRGAVTGLSKSLSLELAPHGITVNCLAPDAILTDRIRQLAVAAGRDPDQEIKAIAEHSPLKRMGDPSEFGAMCAFLCSRQAGYVTGQTIGIDGGSLLGVH